MDRLKPVIVILAAALLTACAPVSQPEINYDPAGLRFDGEQAYTTEADFVGRFPCRHSGAPNNRAAAEWLLERFTSYGLTCEMQEWQIINYSLPTDLQNVACRLPGQSPQEILIVAHHDQSPDTIEGADNDASGISILLQLAEIFASEGTPRYTLAFVSTDAEEYGMIGSFHYVRTHPNVDDILAGMSLDNLGHDYYDAMNMELIGQYRNYGPIWMALTLRDAAAAANLWQVNLRSPLDQILDQAGPISFMDQGPMVAAGIPALGMTGHVPPEFAQLHFDLWHRPEDTMEHQSAEALGNAGLVAEAFARQMLAMDEFPRDLGPYIYFDDSGTILQGAPLTAVFVGFVGIFIAGSLLTLPPGWKAKVESRLRTLPHFLSLWLPLLAGLLTLYAFVTVGLMDKYDTYPATSKDAHIYNPRWAAVILFIVALAVYFYLMRRLAAFWQRRPFSSQDGSTPKSVGMPLQQPSFKDTKSLVLGVVGVTGVYVLFANAFSLLFMAPLLFWFLIAGRKGAGGKALDLLLFLLGGLVFYGLFYFFGFVVYDYSWAFAWFLLMMFSIRMIGFWTAVAITAIAGAGLSLVVEPTNWGNGSRFNVEG